MVEKQKTILFGPLPPPYGGVSAFMSSLCQKAGEWEYEVWSYSGRPEESCGKNARRLDHRRLAHIRELLRHGKHFRIADSTHFHLEYPNAVLLPLWLAAKSIRRFQWVKIVHDGSLPKRFEKFSAVEKALFRVAIRNVDELIAASPDLAIWFVETAGYTGNVSTIPTLMPQVPGPSVEPLQEGVSQALSRLSRYPRRVCSIGAFISAYGFDQVAAAVERIRETSGENIGLLFVDGDFAHDEDYRKAVLRGRDWIEVATNVPHAHIPLLLARGEVFIRATEYESYGLSRVEALWSGLPVIATNAGETRGMLLYEFGDSDALVDYLRKVLSGEARMDIKSWAAVFRSEAERNLENYLKAITGVSIS